MKRLERIAKSWFKILVVLIVICVFIGIAKRIIEYVDNDPFGFVEYLVCEAVLLFSLWGGSLYLNDWGNHE